MLVLMCGIGLAGCGHAPPRATQLPPAPAGQDNPLAAQIAATLIGMPYRAGGDRPAEGFDCSGLVRYCYRLLGLELPRTVAEQRQSTTPVGLDALSVGDLLFFRLSKKIGHVGIYYGDGEFIHAPSTGKAVMRSRLDDPYWQPRLAAAGRPMPATQASRPLSSSGVFTSAGRSAAATGALSRNPWQ